MVYVNGGGGKRHIGNHLSYFRNGELVFIGSNLPHYGFTDRLSGNKSETVVQMKPDFMGNVFLELPEMREIGQLFERARMGLSFHGKTRRKLGSRIEKLSELEPFAAAGSHLHYPCTGCLQRVLSSECPGTGAGNRYAGQQ